LINLVLLYSTEYMYIFAVEPFVIIALQCMLSVYIVGVYKLGSLDIIYVTICCNVFDNVIHIV